jgi:hypothetical protein
MFAHEAPAPGDILVCFYAPAASESPGFCGLGIIVKYLPKTRRFDWLPLPPTDKLKECPWWTVVRLEGPCGLLNLAELRQALAARDTTANVDEPE